MWTNLNTSETLALIKPGCHIARDPDNIRAMLVVRFIGTRYISIVDERRGKTILLATGAEAISGDWWVEHNDQPIAFL
jgi:hypothetical protein